MRDNWMHAHLKEDVKTFLGHFHDGSDGYVVEGYLSEGSVEAVGES